MQRAKASIAYFSVCLISTLASCSNATDLPGLYGAGGTGSGGREVSGGEPSTGGALANSGGFTTGGTASAGRAAGGFGTGSTAGTKAAGGTAGSYSNGGANAGGGSAHTGGASNAAKGGATSTGGNTAKGGASSSGGNAAKGGATSTGGNTAKGGASSSGGVTSSGGTSAATGGVAGSGGTSTMWPNIRVVGNQMRDRWGKPFAIRSIESMFGNGTSDAEPFVAGHKALGANTVGPMPQPNVTSSDAVEALLDAAYQAGLVIGLNADHANQGERFFQNKDIQAVVNRYPNVFLQEAVELGSDMTESQWLEASKGKVDAYVSLYPDKPLKIGSPAGGRSPRYALDRCQDVVDYYQSKGGRGGVIFTCQLYWKAATASWSYQKENGFSDGLPGILEAIDAMAASPCFFLPGLDNEDDVGYTGWREVMDHIRESQSNPALRTSFQWWVYFNSGDSYSNNLTTKANDALSGITATGRDVKTKLDMDRTLIELGPINP
jgi:hypothetical protein